MTRWLENRHTLIAQFCRFAALAVCTIGALNASLLSAADATGWADKQEASPNPRVVDVYPVNANTLTVVIHHGQVIPGGQEPYVPQATDRLKPVRYHNWLERDGKPIGTLVGPDHKYLYRPSQFIDSPLQDDWASNPANYRLQCTEGNDSAYAQPLSPLKVHRKSRPTQMVRYGPHDIDGPREHHLYLVLPSPLIVGHTYELTFTGHQPAIASATYRHEPRRTFSQAVHVSQVGFRPDDPLKLGSLSLWLGDGGGMAFSPDLSFEVVRVSDDQPVFQGKATLAKGVNEIEMPGQVNHNGADVWQLNFSALNQAGEYRLYVEGVGCSLPFRITQTTWRDAFTVSVRGLLHQRSGIALGPPHTNFTRPRPFHPDDGVVIRLTTAAYIIPNKSTDQGDRFRRVVEGQSDQATRDAWGGYMDAADWDRRTDHLIIARYLFDLITAYPAFEKLQLNLPESGNQLPDLVNEALFGLDCFRRMQLEDGSIPGGIESAEHPRIGEASWQESHPIYRFAPDPWSTGLYAATAAQAARVLQVYDPALAQTYADSAMRAMGWLDQLAEKGQLAGYGHVITDVRNLAAVQLYGLTKAPRWHDLFKQTTAFTQARGKLGQWKQFEQGESIFVYLLLPENLTDPVIRKHGMESIIREAQRLIEQGQSTAFGWTGPASVRLGWGRVNTPRYAMPIVYAYRLTSDVKYLQALIRACQYGAGNNPLNLSFTTGVGTQWPQHVTCVDAEITNQPAPPGLTPMGPQEWFVARRFWLNRYMKVHPSLDQWPACEAYFDTGLYTVTNEPTVHNSMAPTFYVWGHLAARPALQQLSANDQPITVPATAQRR